MYTTTAVTQKGQVTLPKKLRDLLGIATYDRVKISLADGYLKVEPTEDILDVIRDMSFKSKKSVLKARDAFEKQYKRI
ncbi:MAG: AbrB/MazE/SpoVT family DNA-binding domain-containing protein [Candidatus Roizmanbacteria bacterium]